MSGEPFRGRLRVAPRARLRWDRHSGQYLLLWPERGMLLDGSAEEILRLCTGAWTLDEIAERLARAHPEAPPERIARDTSDFLESLRERALIDVV